MKKNAIALFSAALVACGGGGGGTATTITPGPPSSTGTQVSDVQGSGGVSPMDGQTVTVSAIVTGDFQNNDADTTRDLEGFYIQQETPDSDPMSSEGVFVFDGSTPATNVNVGDRVDVTGSVAEYFGETQINATSVSVTGTGMIQATDINLPFNTIISNSNGERIPDLERYEGMLVRFPQALTVSGLRFLERYGEVSLSEGGRPYQFTNANVPNATAYVAYVDAIAGRSITLDDGLSSSDPASIRQLRAGAAADYSIRVGDSITAATGNLRYSRGSGSGGTEGWRLEPTEALLFDDDNPRPGTPTVAGSTRIASFNALKFFSNIDTGTDICGPIADANCRGADSAEELSRQVDKAVSTVATMNADVIGLVEIENNATDSISMLVDALNLRIGSGSYAYVDTGTIHTDAIKTGFIYNASTIRTTGPFAVLDTSVDPRFIDTRNRPALAQSFEVIASGAVITVIVNHLKSKGSSCDSIGDPNNNDGQANCNLTRSNAASAIADWINTDPTGSGDTDFLIIGDLNAYLMEDPLTALKNAGLTSLLDGNPGAYSYNFDAQSGALDHAVASPSLVG